tara:strand:- start:76 stop:471 length:396 start_codon:yes stop_codon:yes gene_type:complete
MEFELKKGNTVNKVYLELAFPPSGNIYYRYVNSKVLRSKKAKDYIKYVGLIWLHSKQKSFSKDKRLKLEIFVMSKDKRKRDLDNLLKILCDAMEEARIFNDDSQIDEIVITRGKQHFDHKVLINLTTYSPF